MTVAVTPFCGAGAAGLATSKVNVKSSSAMVSLTDPARVNVLAARVRPIGRTATVAMLPEVNVRDPPDATECDLPVSSVAAMIFGTVSMRYV